MVKKDTIAKEALKCKTAEELIALIQRELGQEQHIYRGVPQEHEWEGQMDISSIIFRKYREQNGKPSKLFDSDHRPVNVEHGIILRAKLHFPDSMTNREILTNIRHFGGLTTLIDFSHDLMVALFFACYGNLGENGQLIALEYGETKLSRHRYFSSTPHRKNVPPAEIEFIEPAITTSTSSARVIAQKSVFVHAPDGFIPPEKCTIFSIPDNLKTEVLAYLKRFHHIEQRTIYNDLHGFIDLENRFATALGHALAGNALFEQEKYEDAEKECTKAINQKPDFAEVYCQRGMIKARRGQIEEAIADFDEAIRINSDYADAHLNRGVVKTKLKQYPEAITSFDNAIRLKPDDAMAWHNRGIARAQSGEPVEAIEDFSRAIKLNPDYSESHYTRGVVRLNLGLEKNNLEQLEEAIKDLTVFIDLKSDVADADVATAYAARGAAWERLGKHEKAQEDYDRAKELGYEMPNNEIVLPEINPI